MPYNVHTRTFLLLPQFPPAFHRGLRALLRSLTQTWILSPRSVPKIGHSPPASIKFKKKSYLQIPKQYLSAFCGFSISLCSILIPHLSPAAAAACSLPVCPFSPPQPPGFTLTSAISLVEQDCGKAFSRPPSLGSRTNCQAGQPDQQGLGTSPGFPIPHRKPAKPTPWTQFPHILGCSYSGSCT